MPITAFHFGPGAAVHSVAPKKISFLAFCAANVLIDVEPLYFMLNHQYPVHRVLHTYVGATFVAVCMVALFVVFRSVSPMNKLPDLFKWKSLRRRQVGAGAAIGAFPTSLWTV